LLIERFRPDIVVGQLGVDSFRTDPLAHLNYTTNGFFEVVGKIKELSPRWIALGGGGYEITNVARAWTLAWAIMNNVAAPDKLADDLPEAFLKRYLLEGFRSGKLRDAEHQEEGAEKEMMRQEVRRVVARIRDQICC